MATFGLSEKMQLAPHVKKGKQMWACAILAALRQHEGILLLSQLYQLAPKYAKPTPWPTERIGEVIGAIKTAANAMVKDGRLIKFAAGTRSVRFALPGTADIGAAKLKKGKRSTKKSRAPRITAGIRASIETAILRQMEMHALSWVKAGCITAELQDTAVSYSSTVILRIMLALASAGKLAMRNLHDGQLSAKGETYKKANYVFAHLLKQGK